MADKTVHTDAAAWRSLRPEVQRFAVAMEEKLRKHDDRMGWSDCPPGHLLRRLRNETNELAAAVQSVTRSTYPERHAADVRSEAADVGNFAMMIADVCGSLGEEVDRG